MKDVRAYKLKDLRPHPAQPPSRTQDTTSLQASLNSPGGQRVPIAVANDDRTVLSGWRRCTAAKALGWTVIAGYREKDIAPDTPAALDFVIAANEQEVMTSLQLIAVLQNYEHHGISFRDACRSSRIKPWKARTLARLAQAPQEVRDAVDLYERGTSKSDYKGISLTAFYQMQDLSGAEQLEILNAGKRTTVEVRQARKKLRIHTAKTLIEDPTSVAAMITVAHELAVRAIALANWLQQADPHYAGDVRIAYSTAVPALQKLTEETEGDKT